MKIQGHIDKTLGQSHRVCVTSNLNMPLCCRRSIRIITLANPDHSPTHLLDLCNLTASFTNHTSNQLIRNIHLVGALPVPLISFPSIPPSYLAPCNACYSCQGASS